MYMRYVLSRVLRAVLGEGCLVVPKAFLERQGDEGRGVAGDDGMEEAFETDASADDWVSGTASFAPWLRLVVELACSCAVAGDDPPHFNLSELQPEELAGTGERA